MTTTPVDICNRALSEIGARATITVIDSSTAAGAQCEIWYNVVREQLLRMAPWAFARATVAMTLLGSRLEDPATSPWPWVYKYQYPDDAIKLNYILPPPPSSSGGVAPSVGTSLIPWCGPSRQYRYLPAYDNSDPETPIKVILTNVADAYAVYVANVVDPEIMDKGFKAAFVAMLASKLVQPLTGNAGMKSDYMKLAEFEITRARVQDGNEAVPTSDHSVDWIATRGITAPYGLGALPDTTAGIWFEGWDPLSSWGM